MQLANWPDINSTTTIEYVSSAHHVLMHPPPSSAPTSCKGYVYSRSIRPLERMMMYVLWSNITLHYITLHYFTLHYITLHYITLHYNYTAYSLDLDMNNNEVPKSDAIMPTGRCI